jgi:hypothetical protein
MGNLFVIEPKLGQDGLPEIFILQVAAGGMVSECAKAGQRGWLPEDFQVKKYLRIIIPERKLKMGRDHPD